MRGTLLLLGSPDRANPRQGTVSGYLSKLVALRPYQRGAIKDIWPGPPFSARIWKSLDASPDAGRLIGEVPNPSRPTKATSRGLKEIHCHNVRLPVILVVPCHYYQHSKWVNAFRIYCMLLI